MYWSKPASDGFAALFCARAGVATYVSAAAARMIRRVEERVCMWVPREGTFGGAANIARRTPRRKRDLSRFLLLGADSLASACLGELAGDSAVETGVIAAPFLLEPHRRALQRVENVA